MRLFQLFRKDKSENRFDKNTLFYHEDDYCQTELSPVENLALFQHESDEINDLAEKSFDGYGYTNIYVRNDDRVKLEVRVISPAELEEIILQTGLKKAAQVKTGYGQTYQEICVNTSGFGKNYSAIYFDYKDDIVKHIWLTNIGGIDKEKLRTCLHQLGTRWNLLLMDWNATKAVDLQNLSSITSYLKDFK